MSFVANFIHFPMCKNFENLLRFDEVIESLKVGTFLRHSVQAEIDDQKKSETGQRVREAIQ